LLRLFASLGSKKSLPAGRQGSGSTEGTRCTYKKKNPSSKMKGSIKKGSDILSHLVIKDETVPSAQAGLTSLFEQSLLNFL
jgi:hypothetical protein